MKITITLFFCFCLVAFSLRCFSQSDELLAKEKEIQLLYGQDRIELIIEVAEDYLEVDALRSQELIQEVEDMIGKPSKKNYKEGVMLSDAYYVKGLAWQKSEKYNEAIEDFSKSYNTARKFDYTYGKNRAEKTLKDLGVNPTNWWKRQLNNLSHLELDEKVKDVTSGLQQATKAMTTREKESRLEKYKRLGKEAELDRNLTLAIDHYQKALSIANMIGDDSNALDLYLLIANLFIEKKNNELAIIVYDSAILFMESSLIWEDDLAMRDSILALKDVIKPKPLIAKKPLVTPKKSLLLADTLLDIEQEIVSNLKNQEEVKAKIESFEKVAEESAASGDYEKALQFKELYFAAQTKYFQDSISNQARIEQLEEKRRNQALELQAQTKLLAEEKNTRILLIASSVLLALLAIVSFYAFRNKRKSHRELKNAYSDLEETIKTLKETQVKLIESEKMASLGQLTAGIAHEINNPINFVTSNINPLKRDIKDVQEFYEAFNQLANSPKESVPPSLLKLRDVLDLDFLIQEMHHLLSGIEEGAVRTKEIVESFRNFARLDEEGYKKVDLKDSILSAINLLSEKAGEGIVFKTHFSEDTHCECQPAKINQVFFHIIHNATQAIKGGLGEVKISIESLSDSIQVKIKDNGDGINQDIANKIYDPFFTTRDVGEGKGLGLSIAYGIVQEHGGEISFETSTGVNSYTEFEIILPKQEVGITKANQIGQDELV